MKTKVVEYIGRIQDAGAETLIKDYALLLDKEKFDVIVLCNFARKDSSIYKTLKDNDIEVIRLYGRYTNICRIISRLFRKFNSILLSRIVKKIKPNVIHIHLELLETVYYSRKALSNVKLLYTCHNLPKTLIGEDLPREEYAAKYLIENNSLQMIALHEDMAEEINSRFGITNTVVIKNGINFDNFKNIKESKEEIKETLSIPNNAYVIGSIGRLTYQKNPEFIIEVFKEAYQKNKNSFLLMVGKGKLENKIIELLKKYNLENRSLILSNRNDIPRILKAMDVFLFPSRYEGLGIVLIEAQVSGIKCVVSNKIPHEAYQSNLITELSLDDTVNKWAETCLKPISNISNYGNIDSYDMKIEIKNLEDLYLK